MFISRQQSSRRCERGDTIIEVVLALAIFAIIMVSMISIMQRASMSAYGALERNQVRQLMNAQGELLTYARDQYIVAATNNGTPAAGTAAAMWKQIRNLASSTAPALSTCADTASASSFYINRSGTTFSMMAGAPAAATGMPVAGKGLWIQKVDPPGYGGGSLKQKYHDFYLLSCWPTVGGDQQTLSTIVRLYESEL